MDIQRMLESIYNCILSGKIQLLAMHYSPWYDAAVTCPQMFSAVHVQSQTLGKQQFFAIFSKSVFLGSLIHLIVI